VVASDKFHVPAALLCEKKPPLTVEKRVVCSNDGLEALEKKGHRGLELQLIGYTIRNIPTILAELHRLSVS